MLGHETTYIDSLGHENSEKSAPWIESHPKIYKILYNIKWLQR